MTNGVATAALVCGIVGVVLLWVPVLGPLIGIAALICGIIGLKNANADSKQEGRGFAIAGIVLGAIAIIFGIFVGIAMLAYFGVLNPLTNNIDGPDKCLTSNPSISCKGAKASATNNNVLFTLHMGPGYPVLEFGEFSQIPAKITYKNGTTLFIQAQGLGETVPTSDAWINVSVDQDITISLSCSQQNCVGKKGEKLRLQFQLTPTNTETGLQDRFDITTDVVVK